MKKKLLVVAALSGLLLSIEARAQVPVQEVADHARLLASPDPRLAANKRLVYDFWREVFEAGNLERADRYLAESYIQHNPRVPTGRAGFVEFFGKIARARPVEARVRTPIVSMLAEGDLVTVAFVREYPDPRAPGKTYTSTWFDQFRIQDGLIVEHWDAATRQ